MVPSGSPWGPWWHSFLQVLVGRWSGALPPRWPGGATLGVVPGRPVVCPHEGTSAATATCGCVRRPSVVLVAMVVHGRRPLMQRAFWCRRWWWLLLRSLFDRLRWSGWQLFRCVYICLLMSIQAAQPGPSPGPRWLTQLRAEAAQH
jgi:hypothetical protein